MVHRLTVGDVERLAKAGVSLRWEQFEHCLIRDEDEPRAPPIHQSNAMGLPNAMGLRQYRDRICPLLDAFEDRWMRNTQARRTSAFTDGFIAMPFDIRAIEVGDKVVCLIGGGDDHFVLEDASNLFPSDGLMAAIHLWLETKK